MKFTHRLTSDIGHVPSAPHSEDKIKNLLSQSDNPNVPSVDFLLNQPSTFKKARMSSQYHGKYVLKTVRVLKKMIFIQCEHIINRHIPRGLLSEARLSYYKIPLSFDEDLNKTLYTKIILKNDFHKNILT